MKIPLKTRLAFMLTSKNSVKKENTRSLKLGLGGNKIHTIAYFLPEKEKFSRLAIHYLNNLNKHNLEIKLIFRSSVSELYTSSINHSGIIISDNKLNRFGLPITSAIDQMKKMFFDAAVDLNPEFDPVHGILMQTVDAPLKIGFESKWSQNIFTITLTADAHGILEKQYNQINQLLGLG